MEKRNGDILQEIIDRGIASYAISVNFCKLAAILEGNFQLQHASIGK
jgi:hypothetical protein